MKDEVPGVQDEIRLSGSKQVGENTKEDAGRIYCVVGLDVLSLTYLSKTMGVRKYMKVALLKRNVIRRPSF